MRVRKLLWMMAHVTMVISKKSWHMCNDVKNIRKMIVNVERICLRVPRSIPEPSLYIEIYTLGSGRIMGGVMWEILLISA